jgi:hypothetical protein
MMNDDIVLNAVNWEHGMLLAPEHLVRQERYFDSAILWALRYTTNAFGLVGGGARLPESERGAVRHDPIVTLSEDQESISISVTQCRALTPSGCIIEVTPDQPAHRRFLKSELDGVAETGVYVTCRPHQKEVIDGPVDEFNPQMRAERCNLHQLSLIVPAEQAPYSISVARIRRPQSGSGYEKDRSYIPACTSMASFSELTAGWRRIVEDIAALSERYTELSRAMQQYLVLFRERGIDTELDRETTNFVGRMVVALEDCIFEVLDPTQTPQSFFGHLRRLAHSAAVYFDLSPPVQQYFAMLKDTGETEFISVMDRQRAALTVTRKWEIHDDLGVEVRSTLHSLAALSRLERALEGKYIDFRLSPSLEAMNFVFDGGGKVLYKLAAKPSRLQGFADELTIHFAQLRLEGRDRYRLILICEPEAKLETGTRINVEIRINEGAGFHRPAINLVCEAKLPEQRNFEFDFEAPDVPTITDLRVSLPARYPMRTALLFNRHRFYAEEAPRVVQEASVARGRAQESPVNSVSSDAPPEAVEKVRESKPAPPVRPAPWDVPRRPDRVAAPEERPGERRPEPGRDVPPPRRRRLE